MKILLSCYWPLPHAGGLAKYVYELKQGLEREGHTLEIFTQHPDRRRYYLACSGRSVGREHIRSLVAGKVMHYLGNDAIPSHIRVREFERYCFEAAAEFLGLTGYHLIHAQDVISARAMARVKPRHTPLIVTIHGSLTYEKLYSLTEGREAAAEDESKIISYSKAEEYHGITSCDLAFTPTFWLSDMLVREFGIPPGLLTIIPYGTDIGAFMTAMQQKESEPRPAGKMVILCAARLNRVKGHTCLFKALARLKKERADWVCWLAGDGGTRSELKQLSQRLGLAQHVKFLGNRDDVPALLNLADIFVLPSLLDNMPYAVIEAMAASKAIAVSDAGGLPEMVRHMENGLVSAKGEAEPLLHNIRLLMDNRALREELAENARSHARERYTLQVMIEHTLAAYNTTLEKKTDTVSDIKEREIPDSVFAPFLR